MLRLKFKFSTFYETVIFECGKREDACCQHWDNDQQDKVFSKGSRLARFILGQGVSF